MKVSPLDLRQQRFRTTFRGFDPNEVTALLDQVADDYEHALRNVDKLQQDVTRLDGLVNEHRDAERNLRNTLLTAQRLADEIRTGAEQDARRIVQEAEGRAELLLQKTQARLEDIQHETDGLKMKRREVENSLESIIASLRNAMEFVKEQEARERDDKILLHRPRPADAPQPAARPVEPERKAQGQA